MGGYDDYPELYTRWFQYAAFLPIMRTHGSRPANEVWSYGKQAEPILEKYLRLRYQLMPYIYSLGYQTWLTGAPFMRALPLDFPDDPKVADLRDEYMFGPAFLVAPVTEQGATSRQVYLPAGADWYNYWTNERVKGGQTITVDAPIDTIPLFVRAGSIIPLGAPVESTHQAQAIEQGARLSRRGCQLHALFRRRQDLCLREGRGFRHPAALGRGQTPADPRGRPRLERAGQRNCGVMGAGH